MNLLCKRALPPVSVIASIGLSDAIEYYLSPDVHEEHNCPDIMQMSWNQYNGWYAFLSGVKCSWFLILPLCVFKHNQTIINILNVINLCIPFGCYFSGKDKADPYFGHKLLYAVNPILLSGSIVAGIVSHFIK